MNRIQTKSFFWHYWCSFSWYVVFNDPTWLPAHEQHHVGEEVTTSCETGEMQQEHPADHTCTLSGDDTVYVCQELQSEGAFGDVDVVIAGLSNVYTHYITTYEEYQVHTDATLSVINSDVISVSCDLLLFRCSDMKVPPPSTVPTRSARTWRSTAAWPEPSHRWFYGGPV